MRPLLYCCTLTLTTIAACVSSPAVTSKPTAGSVAAPDGVSIAYETLGRGPIAIVFVHGWSCDRTYWREQIGHFAAKYRVVSIDLAGHGDSGSNRVVWSIASLGEDVVSVVTALGLERVVLVGHSMGGPVVVEAARRLARQTLGVVVVDSLRDIDARMTSEEVEKFLAPLRENFAATTESWVRRVMFVPTSDPAFVDAIAIDMASAPPQPALSALKALKTWDPGEALDAVDLPILALNAKARHTDRDALARHGVKVTLVPGVGHFIMMEDPAAFNRLLEEAAEEFAQARG